MALVGFLAGWLLALFGAVGVLAPSVWIDLGAALSSPLGLALIAVERLVLGIVFVGAAPRSRAPTAFRVLGVLTFVAGLAVPVLGLGRFAAVLDWWTSPSLATARWRAASASVFGLLIAYGIIPREAR